MQNVTLGKNFVSRGATREGKGRTRWWRGRGWGIGRDGCLIKSLDEYIRNAIRNDIKVKYGVNFKGAFSPFVCLIYLSGRKDSLVSWSDFEKE